MSDPTAFHKTDDTNGTDKASNLCEMIRVGAGVGHHDEAQHDHDDDFCYVGDGPEIATGTQPRVQTHNVTIG